MQQRHRTIDLLLRRAVARGRKTHRPELFARHGMLMLLRDAAAGRQNQNAGAKDSRAQHGRPSVIPTADYSVMSTFSCNRIRSEEHTSELQSLAYLVCRLLLEKKKKTKRCVA